MAKSVRLELRQKRRNLSKAKKHKSNINILHNLLKNRVLKYKKIAIYTQNDGEVPTDKIIDFLTKFGIEVYLPVLDKDKLKFAKITNNYKLNKFGIKEPTSTKIHAKQMNLIILPLVGFDEFNNRIGMGGGYYDKSLSFKLKQNNFKPPKLFGLAYKFQKIKITPNPWDIRLDKVVV
jgi:5-formyltetrahydrofolate cyclo-ligase